MLEKPLLTPAAGEATSRLIQVSMTVPASEPQNLYLKPFTSAKDPLSAPLVCADLCEEVANYSPGFLNALFHPTFRTLIFLKTLTGAPISFPHEDLLTPKRI